MRDLANCAIVNTDLKKTSMKPSDFFPMAAVVCIYCIVNSVVDLIIDIILVLYELWPVIEALIL